MAWAHSEEFEEQEFLDFIWWRVEGRQFSMLYLYLLLGLEGVS